jgi:hypothetical protein
MTTTTPQAINLVPAVVQVRVAVGASVGLRIRATHADGTPFDLSPYTVEAPIKSDGVAPPVAAWAVYVEANTAVVLSLSPADTALLSPTGKSTAWHWDVWLQHVTAPERLLFAHGSLGLVSP